LDIERRPNPMSILHTTQSVEEGIACTTLRVRAGNEASLYPSRKQLGPAPWGHATLVGVPSSSTSQVYSSHPHLSAALRPPRMRVARSSTSCLSQAASP
jgi:hypothetical protein